MGAMIYRAAPAVALISLVAVGLAGDEVSPGELVRRAEQQLIAGNPQQALELAGRAIAAEPANPRWHNYRGGLRFRLGMIRPSIDDFDRAIELAPHTAPHHWQRGISYYYAGEFEKGAKQFELHQTVNRNDVENAVWHFLCVAKWKGLEEAKARLIPIQGDPRVPMMQVHALFAGHATPADVLAAAREGDPAAAELAQRLFYAHLYLGLYYEAHGQTERSAEHIRIAVERYPAQHYMGDVARVHQTLRK